MPPYASVWYYFRETDYDHIKELWELGDTMAKAAAMMTGTTVESRVLGSAWPQHGNRPIAEVMFDNIKRSACRNGARRISSSRARFSARMGVAGARAVDDRRAALQRTRIDSRTRADRRRLRRYRRHHVERADGDAQLSLEHPRRAPAIIGPARWRWPHRSRTKARRRARK